ncbi:MAG: molecular chaperone TorD family protein [Nitrospirae bacterium]|nr:molecular chaperone TorD family protein [Nitrospirota bacterium]MBF0618313.1 molecular chaperone TorD family protein [Nitrospirota bacterium]
MAPVMVESSRVVSLLSSMYLCKPVKAAIEKWKIALYEDKSLFMWDLKEALGEIDTESEKELEDLLWDFTQLFIGPYKMLCPPWESVYTSSKRLMMQEAHDEVRTFYHEAGLAMNTPDIMSDHIGAELNFLAVLLQKMNIESEKRQNCLYLTKRFIDEHLRAWIPQFTNDMEAAADTDFYKALAQTTRNLNDFFRF